MPEQYRIISKFKVIWFEPRKTHIDAEASPKPANISSFTVCFMPSSRDPLLLLLAQILTLPPCLVG